MTNTNKKSSAGRFFVGSLVVAFFSTWVIESLTGVFLVDVTGTFFGSSVPVTIATTGQLVTISSVVSVVFALLLGVLSINHNHKRLLLLGCVGIITGILGCFLASDFVFMQVFFSLEGIGTTAIGAMSFTLVGEFLDENKRPKAIGWILAGSSFANIIGSIIISMFFSDQGGWRSYLLWFALPISVVSLVVVYFGVPSLPQKPKDAKMEDYISSFKQIFLKKSAIGCLIGAMFRQAGLVWTTVYSATFFRTQFGISLAFAAVLGLIGGVIFVLAEIVGGYLVHRIGRKRQLVATLVISSPLLMIIAFVSNLWVVLVLSWVGCFIYGMSFPANTSLILEQAPESRGTMMSMSTIFVTFGMAIGTTIGGAALITHGWAGLILTFATLQLIAAAVFFFLSKDTYKT